jgi:MerR family copper efflux transcriptional regulator
MFCAPRTTSALLSMRFTRLLDLAGSLAPSADVKRIALAHIATLKDKLAELQRMVVTLEHFAGHCCGDARPECPIMDDLAGKTDVPMPRNEPRISERRASVERSPMS